MSFEPAVGLTFLFEAIASVVDFVED